MAVEDKYVDANIVDKRLTGSMAAQGSKTVTMVSTFEVAAADDNGSIYRIFPSIPSDLVPVRITILNDVIAGGDDWDLGLYKPELGTVIDKDILMDGADLTSAYDRNPGLDGLSAVDVANVQKSLYELAGQSVSNRDQTVDIALTANTVGTGAGTVSAIGEFISP